MSNVEYSDRDCTVYVGSIDQKVTEELIFELFLQAGPLERVKIPTDKERGVQKSFGFVTFTSPVSVPYAIDLLDGTSLYGQKIVVRPQTGSSTPSGSGNRGSQSPLTPSSLMGSPNFPVPVRQNSFEQNHSNRHVTPIQNQYLNSPFIQGPMRQNIYEQTVSNHYGYQTPTNQLSSHHRSSSTSRHGSLRRDSYDEDRHGRNSSKHHHSHHNDSIHKARSYRDQRSSRY